MSEIRFVGTDKTRGYPYLVGAPVAQWVKRWPTDLVVVS